jgi:hypothetical protein
MYMQPICLLVLCVRLKLLNEFWGQNANRSLTYRLNFEKMKCCADFSEIWFESYSVLLLKRYIFFNSLKIIRGI